MLFLWTELLLPDGEPALKFAVTSPISEEYIAY